MHLITKLDQKTGANATHFTKLDQFLQNWIIRLQLYKTGSFMDINYKTGSQNWISLMIDSDWSAAEPRGVSAVTAQE